jgi:LysR family glycine cleavage system transcriptional activator
MRARDLPPLGALRAFEAVARHSSFKAAASEIGVTPTAISHQVRLLEDVIGQRLLERSPRSVSLTAAGQLLFVAARDSFDAIHEVMGRLRWARGHPVLTVSATPAFISGWLLPRLPDFRSAHPHIDLRLHASDDVVDLRSGAIDAAIRYGPGPFPDLAAVRLTRDALAPVCSPRLGVTRLEDLRQVPLLHTEGRRLLNNAPDWKAWSEAAGVTGLAIDCGPRFTDDAHAMQAAIAGHGVAILSLLLVQGELASGVLVQPFPQTLAGEAYHFLCSPRIAERPDIDALRAWLISRFRSCPDAAGT